MEWSHCLWSYPLRLLNPLRFHQTWIQSWRKHPQLCRNWSLRCPGNDYWQRKSWKRMRLWLRKSRYQRWVPWGRLGWPKLEILLWGDQRMEVSRDLNRKRPLLQQQITSQQPCYWVGRQQERRYVPNNLLGLSLQKS